MSRQWIRAFSLQVGIDKAGQALDLSAFRCKFQIRQGFTDTPGHAVIKVYNLSEQTMNQLCALTPNSLARPTPNSLRVRLQTGYDGQCSTLFEGQLYNVRRGRESATDTFIEIVAQSGDQAYTQAVINQTLAAGARPVDQLQAIAKAIAPYGITLGPLPPMSNQQFPRGQTLYGPVRSVLDTFARSQQLTWGFRDKQLIFTPLYGKHPVAPLNQAIVLNAATGLIGMPRLSSIGLQVRALINPQISFGGQIKLNNADIQSDTPTVNINNQPGNVMLSSQALSADGYYKVFVVNCLGDTRGQEWYMDIIAAGVNTTLPPLSGPIYQATP